MKLTMLIIASFFTFESFGAVCSYRKGETISKRTGQRIYQTVSPKVLPNIQRIEYSISDEELVLTSSFDPMKFEGSLTCSDSDLRPDFDCYESRDIKMGHVINVYIGNKSQKEIYLVDSLKISGGAIQQDQYFCSL